MDKRLVEITEFVLCKFQVDQPKGDYMRLRIFRPYGSKVVRCPDHGINDFYVENCHLCNCFGGIKK